MNPVIPSKSATPAETCLRWDASSQGYAEATTGKQRAPFVAGPLPLDWISAAAALDGKTLHVGLAIWYLSGLTKSRTVRLTSKALALFGVSRDAKYPALKRLMEAGLVTVEQRPGCLPLVTLVSGQDTGSSAGLE